MVLITILDNITETSMPYNEFVLYRFRHFSDEKQILIVCSDEKQNSSVAVPEGLKVIFAGRKIKSIREAIKSQIKQCKEEGSRYVFHLHQVKSALLSEISMFGTGFRKKVLFTVHNTFSGYSFHNKVLSFLNGLFARRISCVSNAAFGSYPRIIKALKKNRISPIQNGMDTERIDSILQSANGKQDHNTVDFIYVARMVPVKNHRFLLDVLEKAKENVRFIFVGAEDQNGEIRKIAALKGVEDKVLFTGLISRNEVFQRLNDADVYISSSTVEGLPVSVLEAMYCSLPCILSSIPQHLEIGNGEQGSINFLELDLNKWIDKVNWFASLPKETIRYLGEGAKEYVKSLFSLEKMHSEYNKLYKELC